jgi:MFS family permease
VIGGLAAIAGPILGGLLIHADLFGLGWRMIFLVNAPVGLIAMLMGLRFLPAMRSPHGSGFDPLGTLLFALAIAGLVWPLIAMEHAGLACRNWPALRHRPSASCWAGVICGNAADRLNRCCSPPACLPCPASVWAS